MTQLRLTPGNFTLYRAYPDGLNESTLPGH